MLLLCFIAAAAAIRRHSFTADSHEALNRIRRTSAANPRLGSNGIPEYRGRRPMAQNNVATLRSNSGRANSLRTTPTSYQYNKPLPPANTTPKAYNPRNSLSKSASHQSLSSYSKAGYRQPATQSTQTVINPDRSMSLTTTTIRTLGSFQLISTKTTPIRAPPTKPKSSSSVHRQKGGSSNYASSLLSMESDLDSVMEEDYSPMDHNHNNPNHPRYNHRAHMILDDIPDDLNEMAHTPPRASHHASLSPQYSSYDSSERHHRPTQRSFSPMKSALKHDNSRNDSMSSNVISEESTNADLLGSNPAKRHSKVSFSSNDAINEYNARNPPSASASTAANDSLAVHPSQQRPSLGAKYTYDSNNHAVSKRSPSSPSGAQHPQLNNSKQTQNGAVPMILVPPKKNTATRPPAAKSKALAAKSAHQAAKESARQQQQSVPAYQDMNSTNANGHDNFYYNEEDNDANTSSDESDYSLYSDASDFPMPIDGPNTPISYPNSYSSNYSPSPKPRSQPTFVTSTNVKNNAKITVPPSKTVSSQLKSQKQQVPSSSDHYVYPGKKQRPVDGSHQPANKDMATAASDVSHNKSAQKSSRSGVQPAAATVAAAKAAKRSSGINSSTDVPTHQQPLVKSTTTTTRKVKQQLQPQQLQNPVSKSLKSGPKPTKGPDAIYILPPKQKSVTPNAALDPMNDLENVDDNNNNGGLSHSYRALAGDRDEDFSENENVDNFEEDILLPINVPDSNVQSALSKDIDDSEEEGDAEEEEESVYSEDEKEEEEPVAVKVLTLEKYEDAQGPSYTEASLDPEVIKFDSDSPISNNDQFDSKAVSDSHKKLGEGSLFIPTKLHPASPRLEQEQEYKESKLKNGDNALLFKSEQPHHTQPPQQQPRTLRSKVSDNSLSAIRENSSENVPQRKQKPVQGSTSTSYGAAPTTPRKQGQNLNTTRHQSMPTGKARPQNPQTPQQPQLQQRQAGARPQSYQQRPAASQKLQQQQQRQRPQSHLPATKTKVVSNSLPNSPAFASGSTFKPIANTTTRDNFPSLEPTLSDSSFEEDRTRRRKEREARGKNGFRLLSLRSTRPEMSYDLASSADPSPSAANDKAGRTLSLNSPTRSPGKFAAAQGPPSRQPFKSRIADDSDSDYEVMVSETFSVLKKKPRQGSFSGGFLNSLRSTKSPSSSSNNNTAVPSSSAVAAPAPVVVAPATPVTSNVPASNLDAAKLLPSPTFSKPEDTHFGKLSAPSSPLFSTKEQMGHNPSSSVDGSSSLNYPQAPFNNPASPSSSSPGSPGLSKTSTSSPQEKKRGPLSALLARRQRIVDMQQQQSRERKEQRERKAEEQILNKGNGVGGNASGASVSANNTPNLNNNPKFESIMEYNNNIDNLNDIRYPQAHHGSSNDVSTSSPKTNRSYPQSQSSQPTTATNVTLATNISTPMASPIKASTGLEVGAPISTGTAQFDPVVSNPLGTTTSGQPQVLELSDLPAFADSKSAENAGNGAAVSPLAAKKEKKKFSLKNIFKKNKA